MKPGDKVITSEEYRINEQPIPIGFEEFMQTVEIEAEIMISHAVLIRDNKVILEIRGLRRRS